MLRIKIYIRNRIDQLVEIIKSIKKARSRIEDAESQLKAPGPSNADDPQALIQQAEDAFNTLIESADQGIFKGSILVEGLAGQGQLSHYATASGHVLTDSIRTTATTTWKHLW